MFGFKRNKQDPLHNRRRLMVFALVYAIAWGFIILYCSIAYEWGAAKSGTFLGYISTISGLGIFGYYQAAAKQDTAESPEGNDAED